MTSDAKIGLLLGLVFIFIIAFVVNGLPRLRSEPDGNELTVISAEGVVTAENTLPGLGERERSTEEIFPTWTQQQEPDTTTIQQTAQLQTETIQDPDIRYTKPLPQEPPASTTDLLTEWSSASKSFVQNWIKKSPDWVVKTENSVVPVQNQNSIQKAHISTPTVEEAAKKVVLDQTMAPKETTVQPDPGAFIAQPIITRTETTKPGWPKAYVVESGDNLGVIAKKFYGEELGNKIVNVNRIFEANSGILESPHTVKAGQKLMIPALPDSPPVQEQNVFPKTLVETVNAIAPVKPKPTEVVVQPSNKYYVAQDGDSLWKIASQELGKGSRYKEIYALNSDIMEDPITVVPGMRLRMPVK